MKRGIVLPQHEVTPAECIIAAQAAEEAGLDSVWVVEHLHGRPKPERPVLECWTLLAAVAASTSRVTIGPLVTRVGLRAPLVSATMAKTVNDIADGRLIVGLGLGDPTVRDEQEAYGLGYASRADRIAEVEATIRVMREVAEVPVWIGGASGEALRLAGMTQGLNLWIPASEIDEALGRFDAPSGDGFEVSWAGSWPRGGLVEVLRPGIDHVIVATGGHNYAERIQQLAG